MESELLSLLDYQSVVAAVASTPDGLVVASVGIDGEDAESVAAAGSALAMASAEGGEPAVALDVAEGSLFLAVGRELMLVVLAEPDVVGEVLADVMLEKVAALDVELARGA